MLLKSKQMYTDLQEDIVTNWIPYTFGLVMVNRGAKVQWKETTC